MTCREPSVWGTGDAAWVKATKKRSLTPSTLNSTVTTAKERVWIGAEH